MGFWFWTYLFQLQLWANPTIKCNRLVYKSICVFIHNFYWNLWKSRDEYHKWLRQCSYQVTGPSTCNAMITLSVVLATPFQFVWVIIWRWAHRYNPNVSWYCCVLYLYIYSDGLSCRDRYICIWIDTCWVSYKKAMQYLYWLSGGYIFWLGNGARSVFYSFIRP